MGLLCERIQIKSDDDVDVKERQLKRIQNATIMVCDTTTRPMIMIPMLYLYLGCAWGANVPTVLIITRDPDLECDEKHYSRGYKNIRELQD